MQPRFSLLIPARDRPVTLRHTLATVMDQPGDDYEVVVADNAGRPEVASVVAEFAAPRLRHSRSDEVLPMAANWERGLALCNGDYVTVVGDDDALVPSALIALRRLVAATQAELITWRAHVYWWPDTIVPWNRNRLYLNLGGGAKLAKSRSMLEQFYRGALGFEVVPTIYTSFFHRRLIDEARRRHGGFFVPTDTAPDVASGILGLYLTERFAVSGRPLCIRGNSLRSNGTAQWARSLGAAQREVYFREERVGLQGFIHKDLVPSPNLSIIIASAKMKCRDRYFPNDAVLAVDLPGLVRELVDNLNREPDAYEDNLRDAKALAAKIGMALDPASIPPREARSPVSSWGPIPNDEGQVDRLCVNGELAGVQDIAAAARLSEALMPPIEGFLGSDSTPAKQAPRKTRVSVLIPVFERRELVAAAIQSALAQQVEGLEVVVVDNHSQDGTWERLQEMKDPRLRCLRNASNLGLFGNYNRCAAEAAGEYVLFLGSDDRLEPGFLAHALTLLDAAPQAVLLSSRGRMIDREGRGQGTIADGFAPGRYEGASATPAWFWSSTHYGANPLNYPSGVVFRAAALRACLPFRSELGAPADIDLFLRVLCHGDLIVTNTLGCAVMMHAGQEGLKARAGNEVTRQQLALMEVFRPELEAAGAWASVRRQSSALAFAALARTALKEPGLLGDEYRAFGRGAIEMIVAAKFLFFLRFLNVFGARFARYLRAAGHAPAIVQKR